jgi:hypothetical protein
LRRSAFWASFARGICHKHTTSYDIHQSALDFRRNRNRRSNSKLPFAFGESIVSLGHLTLGIKTQEIGFQLRTSHSTERFNVNWFTTEPSPFQEDTKVLSRERVCAYAAPISHFTASQSVVRKDFPPKGFSPGSGHFDKARWGLSPGNLT